MESKQVFKVKLSKRLEGVSESATLKLNATVQAMKAQGVNVVNLTAGEPDFSVPEAANQAVIDALKAHRSKYTPVPGIAELREAVAKKTNRQQPSLSKDQPWKGSHVVVSNGGKQALFNSLLVLLNPGDEVLIPSPYWLSYPEMVKLAGGIPKFISTSSAQNFKISPTQLKAALGPRVKALILNSPSNPTGMMYSRQEYRALADILVETEGPQAGAHGGVVILSDEIYDRIALGKVPFCSFLEAAPELRERTITINGMSKSAAMTGWRIGWTVASETITQGLITLQGQSTSGINALAQWASLSALNLDESHFESQISEYRKRRDILVERLKKMRKIEVISPDGAFYVFVGIKEHLKENEDSIAFAQRLLEDAKVAVVPGTPFGEPEYIRLSFATETASLIEGCDRISRYLS